MLVQLYIAILVYRVFLTKVVIDPWNLLPLKAIVNLFSLFSGFNQKIVLMASRGFQCLLEALKIFLKLSVAQ